MTFKHQSAPFEVRHDPTLFGLTDEIKFKKAPLEHGRWREKQSALPSTHICGIVLEGDLCENIAEKETSATATSVGLLKQTPPG